MGFVSFERLLRSLLIDWTCMYFSVDVKSHSKNWAREIQPGFTILDKCQDRNRIMLNPTPLLQATDPLHNIYFLHSSSFMPFTTVKSSTCKTQAQVIGLKLINSSRPFCLSQPSPGSHVANNKNNTPSCLCITLGAGNRLDYHCMFKNSAAKWHADRN